MINFQCLKIVKL